MQLLWPLLIIGVQRSVLVWSLVWRKVDDISEYMSTAHYLSTHTTFSSMRCARVCGKDPHCNAFLHAAASYTCHLFEPSDVMEHNFVETGALLFTLNPVENVEAELVVDDKVSGNTSDEYDIGGIDVPGNISDDIGGIDVKVYGNISDFEGVIVAQVTNPGIEKTSGMAASRRHPGMLYVHNDNGYTTGDFNIYVISDTGQTQATLQIEGVPFEDCEDMAVSKCSSDVNSEYCMYLADVGDGARRLKGDFAVYRIPEPEVLQDQTIYVSPTDVLNFTWPEEPVSETILVDPDADVYIISKHWDNEGKIARLPDSAWGSNSTVQLPNDLPVIKGLPEDMSGPKAGDISADGNRIIIMTKTGMYYWDTMGSRDYQSVLQGPPVTAPYIFEGDAEAVCWDAGGDGYYSLPKDENSNLVYYSDK